MRSESLTENEDSGEEEPKYGPVPENIIMYKFNYLIKANKNYVIFSCLLMQIQHICDYTVITTKIEDWRQGKIIVYISIL